MVKPMAVRPRRNKGGRLKAFGRRVAWYGSLAALVGGIRAYQDPHVAANLKPLFHWPPSLRVPSNEEIRAAPSSAEWFVKNHALVPQDSLSLHIAGRHGLHELSPRLVLSKGELDLFKKIAPDDSHVVAVTAVFADLVKELPEHRITPDAVDSLLLKKITSLHPLSAKNKGYSFEERAALGQSALDYHFCREIADNYAAFSDAEKQRLAEALKRIRKLRGS